MEVHLLRAGLTYSVIEQASESELVRWYSVISTMDELAAENR